MKYYPFTVGVLLSVTPLFAAWYDEDANTAQNAELQAQMNDVRTVTVFDTAGAKTALGGYPNLKKKSAWFVTADFLWWHLYEGGTDFVVKQNSVVGPEFSDQLKKFDFETRPGLRVGLGYVLSHDGWDLYLNYTWYKTHAKSSASATADESLFPLIGPTQIVGTGEAEGRWKVHFSTLDLEIGRSYFLSRYLSLRPHFGVKSAWIHQKVDFNFPLGDQLGSSDVTSQDTKIKNDFWGIGPRVGAGGKWMFCRHFGLYGGVSGALLWGHFRVREVDAQTLSVSPFAQTFKRKLNEDRIAPTAQLDIGLSYDTIFHFKRCRHHLGLKLGYESQYWWRQNQIPQFESPTRFHRFSEDLMIHGLVAEARLTF
jgi:hypothetical protein